MVTVTPDKQAVSYDSEKRSVVSGLESLRDADVLYEELSVTLGRPPRKPKSTTNPDRLRELFSELHERAKAPDGPQRRAALCLSGGGIRSATFSLGVIQGLAKTGLLEKFHYLSTVSGGGYVGSWLTSASYRHPDGIKGFSEDLKNQGDSHTSPGSGPAAVARLRDFSHFLAPRFGPLKADTWTLLLIALRNVAANWLVLVPLMLALIGLVIMLAVGLPNLPTTPQRNAVFVVAAFFGAIAVAGIHVNATSRTSNLTERGFVGSFLAVLFVATVLTAPFLAIPTDHGWFPEWPGLVIGVAVIHLFCWLSIVPSVDELPERNAFRRWRLRLIWAFSAAMGGAVCGFALVAARALMENMSSWHQLVAGPPLVIASLLAGGFVYLAASSWALRSHQMEWYSRSGAWLTIFALIWVTATTVVIWGGWTATVVMHTWDRVTIASGFVGLGLVAMFAARLSRGRRGRTATIARVVAGTTAPAFLVLLVSLLASVWFWRFAVSPDVRFALNWAGPAQSVADAIATHGRSPVWIIVGLALAAVLLDYVADLNEFTPHVMYRDRLVRAYIAAPGGQTGESSFTGFDQSADVRLWQLRPGLFRPPDEADLSLISDQLMGVRKASPARVRLPKKVSWVANWLAGFERLRGSTRSYVAPGAAQPETISNKLARYLRYDNWDVATWRQKRGAWNSVILEMAGQRATQTPACDDVSSTALSTSDILAARETLMARASEEVASPELSVACARLARPHADARILYPVLNTTLNLVSGGYLRWQQRKAESFAVTPMHAGASSVGSRRMAEYSARTRQVEFYGGTEESGTTLGTIAAVSGAAANPSMGAFSSPAVTFLLTFFNARLGRWMPNPRQKAAYKSIPFFTMPLLAAEAMGLTNAERRWINLSDGGHFENLAVYEMVWSRCHTILLVDAGCDPDGGFKDLQNAIHKIRVDLGIHITFTQDPFADAKNGKAAHCYEATIHYSDVDKNAENGTLIYVKPVVDGDEPLDVLAYRRRHPRFPHQTTADQFFNETQFESYRALGLHTIDHCPRIAQLL